MEQVCRVLEVSRSGYYGWLERKPGVRSQKNQALRRRMIELHEKYPAMGLDSLYHLLKPEFGCSRKRVHRQMRPGVNPKFCVNSIWGANRAKFI